MNQCRSEFLEPNQFFTNRYSNNFLYSPQTTYFNERDFYSPCNFLKLDTSVEQNLKEINLNLGAGEFSGTNNNITNYTNSTVSKTDNLGEFKKSSFKNNSDIINFERKK